MNVSINISDVKIEDGQKQTEGFNVEPSRVGLLLQHACQLGDLDTVIAMRPTASLVEASLHALPVAAKAGHMAVVQELLSWPLPELERRVAGWVGELAEGGHFAIVDRLVAASLDRPSCGVAERQKFLIAIACTGNRSLFQRLFRTVGHAMDWTHVAFNAAYFEHWTCAAMAWQKSDRDDVDFYLSDSETRHIEDEIRSWRAILERSILRSCTPKQALPDSCHGRRL
jgi:hypothetical protein